MPDPSDIDPIFPLPSPHLTKTVAREWKSSKFRKSIDATFCYKQTTFDLQVKINEPSLFTNLRDLKFASDTSSETLSLLYLKLSSSLYSTYSVDDILNWE